jgi:hypothetical protein
MNPYTVKRYGAYLSFIFNHRPDSCGFDLMLSLKPSLLFLDTVLIVPPYMESEIENCLLVFGYKRI